LLKGGSEGLISQYDANIQTVQAFLLATSLKNVQVGDRSGLDIWDRLYTVTAFYVGIADDLTPYDYLWALDQVFGNNFTLSSMAEEDNLLALKTELALLPSPQIYGGTGNIILSLPVTNESLNEVLDMTKGMRFMGQRFIPDSYMFQHLVFPEVCDYLGDLQSLPFTAGNDGFGGLSRVYMRGLDMMALLGSNEALKILIEEGDTDYQHFWQRFGELKDEFNAINQTDWNRNLYWSWLYTLKPLLCELPDGYPNFMRTMTWQRHQLNSALVSWTQLRHDTILYAKQSYTIGRGGGPPLPPSAYIEPLPVFWGRLLSLTRMTLQGLDDLDVLTPEARRRFTELEELLQRMLDIVAKQLMNESLSSEERGFSTTLIRNLDSIITGTENIALRTTLVADVHTNPAEGQVVEEATGKVDLIIVACQDTDGLVFLAVGPVLSYYEFKHPMSDRLTDETWRQMLNSPDRPNRPTWYTPLILQSEKPSYPTGWTRLTNNEVDDFSPRWSPDGQKIAFASNYDIYVMNIYGSEQKNLTDNPEYDGTPCWSPDGQKIVFASGTYSRREIYIMNADGTEQKKITNNSTYNLSPSWSPNGKQIVFVSDRDSDKDQNFDIYVMNADGSEQTKLTDNPGYDGVPCWSPDGQKIAFVSITGNRIMYHDIYVMNADGSEQKRLTDNLSNNWSPSWSPDGKKIAFASDRDGNYEIYVMNADGAEQRNLTNNPDYDGSPSWSPDGKKIAFSSYIYGNLEIFIMNVAE
jgi:Tol biopolymer transport system component